MTSQTVTTLPFSESSDGAPVQVTATASSGTLIHAVSATAGDVERIYLWAANTSNIPEKVTVQFGGTSASDALVAWIQPETEVLVISGAVLKNGLSIRAYALVSSTIKITGHAHLIQPDLA